MIRGRGPARRRGARLAAMLAWAVAWAVGGFVTPAAAERVIALAPLATLGAEDTSAPALATVAQLEKALGALPSTKVIGNAQVAAAIKRAKRPALAGCDGDAACIVELGQLAGATVVVTGQSGGLGEARVIYLSAIDVATGKELGSTTWSTGAADTATAATIRLLAPQQYTGTLKIVTEVKDATLYVNGRKLGAPSAPFSLPVGTHALRVTHPEFRDFVRFVDVTYGETTEVAVALQPLPVVQRDLARRGSASPVAAHPAWYRQWWAVAGGAAAIALVAGTLAYYGANDFSPDVTLP